MTILYYVHDPMCSWCWGFAQVWQQTQGALPKGVRVQRLLGGLAGDNDQPMSMEMQTQLAETWRRISAQIPGVEFNFEFWSRCSPRRSTYPACRAVIAARSQGQQYDTAMTRAIQHAYYLQARNPSEQATLIELAAELGLDTQLFADSLRSAETQRILLEEISLSRSMGADSFPSLVLEHGNNRWQIAIDYRDSQPMLETIAMLMAKQTPA